MMLVGGTTTVAVGLNSRMPDSTERALIAARHPSTLEHAAQDANDCARTRPPNGICSAALNDITSPSARFSEAFELGDELFSHQFTAAEGGGANVGDGGRYTRMPRADLTGFGQWATHTPSRATGPNAASCDACHNEGAEDGAGAAALNVHRDPNHTGNIGQMIERNTPHLLGLAGEQLLAEEMTGQLQTIRQNARNAACGTAGFAQADLTVRFGQAPNQTTVNFGVYRVSRTSGAQNPPCPFNDQSSTFIGIDSDLVVKPFQWKGVEPTVRSFVRGAMHNENGVQAVEMTGDGVDGDGDGVNNELTVGDITALAVYMAAQARPTTKLEINSLGRLSPALTAADIAQINRGNTLFAQIGCATCHVMSYRTAGRTFSEPSQNASYRDLAFPAGQSPASRGVTQGNAVLFDITRDQPDNAVPLGNGDTLGAFRRAGTGAQIDIFSDLKRHRMGFDLQENIDETGHGADTFITRGLWGVGSTAPYMHDGRATTLTEAILFHTGQTEQITFNGRPVNTPNFTRVNFIAATGCSPCLTSAQQADLIAFLDNLILFRTD